MVGDIRMQTPLSLHTSEMLAQAIVHVIDGSARPGETTATLRRVCEESRGQPPEQLLLRIKELWTKIAGSAGMTYEEGDRRYFAFIGQCLALYYTPSVQSGRHAPVRDLRRVGGCGEPEAIPIL